MKLLFFALVLFYSMTSYSTFLPSPEINCIPAENMNDGFIYEVWLKDSGYASKLLQVTPSNPEQPREISEKDTLINVTKKGDLCEINITQLNNSDGNSLNLKVYANNAGGGNIGRLKMYYNGLNINENSSFSKMSCFILQESFNELCSPSFSGEFYHKKDPAQ